MISKLKGKVEEIGDTWVDLDVQGVCYRLGCASKTLSHLPAVGESVILYTQMIVREDDISLLGFQSAEERALFHLLTSVQGVGTRVGLGLFAIGTSREIVQAIAREDKAFICQADGVGPKLAGRLINELKNKVEKAFASMASTASLTPAEEYPNEQTAGSSVHPFPDRGLQKDAVAALVSLGYRSTEASLTVDTILKTAANHDTLQDVIRQSLSKLSRS